MIDGISNDSNRVSYRTVVKKDEMRRKAVKYPHGWTLVDENIENVERVKLDPKTQRELGCLVGEHVFLEYPWAYVRRDVVAKFAKSPDSSLAVFREHIEIYEADTFLVGYSSTELKSDEFVICLTEEARDLVRQRNRNITRIIWKKVIGKVIKTVKPWNSLGSDLEVEETFVRNTREYFEIEIVLPGRFLNSCRTLCDRSANDFRGSYVQLINEDEKFENVDRKCICRAVQTYMQPRETFVQTCPEYPKNAWTQYACEDILSEFMVGNNEEEGQLKEGSEKDDDDRPQREDAIQCKEIEKPREKTALELFLEARSQQMIDAIKYNAAVNLHVDDIENLSNREEDISTVFNTPAFHEQASFTDFNFTANRTVSDVSLHPKFTEYLAISYISKSRFSEQTRMNECRNKTEFQTRVLLWKLNDPLRPQLALQDHREIYSISFCPYDDNLLIGGRSTGQIVIWNIKEFLNNLDDGNIKLGTSTRNSLPVFRPIVVSDKHRSHQLPVRNIRWIPAKYNTEPDGSLTKPFVSSDVQLLTASEDGTIAVWNISLRSRHSIRNDEDSDEPLRPSFRIKIQTVDEKPRFTSLCFCFPPIVAEHGENSPDMNKNDVREKDCITKYLWIGCVEGLITCAWEKQIFEKNSTDIIECDMLNCSYAHNGPVVEITRSAHLQNVLLTVGGRVFAIWDDDHIDSPLFWRTTSSRYTSCCWANEPGVFLVGSQDGNLEMWDIKNESTQPIFTQIVSLEPITYLTLLESPVLYNDGFKKIGVGDGGGLFRVFTEAEVSRNESTIERMDWFEQYTWKETRRKKLFTSWQNDFLNNDPAIVAKKLARHEEQVKREAKEARERLRREQETRLRLQAEKRARSVPIPKDVAWKSKEFDRMKEVLLSKRNLVPSELEEKRIPFVALQAERDAKLGKVQDKIAHRDVYLFNTLSAKFPELLETKAEAPEFEEFIPVELGKSLNYYVQKFTEIRCKANEALENNLAS